VHPTQVAHQAKVDERFPESLKADVSSVATFIPSRSPEFKVHSKVGLAHSALGGRGFYESRAKYVLTDGVWKRVWAYVPPDNCRRCGRRYSDVLAEQKRQAEEAGRFFHPRHAKYHSDPTYDGPKWCEEPVCRICVDEINLEAIKAEQEAAARMLRSVTN